MLEGLEVSEVWLSELKNENNSFRIDSEYLKKEYLQNIKTLNSFRLGYIKLVDVIKQITGGATPLGAEYQEEGIPFLRVQNIMQNYFNLSDIVYLSEKQDEEIKRSRLKENDVLLTITGVSYGKSAVVPKALVNANINQHSVKITLTSGLNPYFLSAFFNAKQGKLQSDRNIVGVTRPALDYNVIRNFLIPNVSVEFQKNIENTIKKSYQLIEQSQTLYRQAEKLLLETIGLRDFQPSQAGTNIKSFKESFLATGRLDAEYYQPKYGEIENWIKTKLYSVVHKEFNISRNLIDYSAKQYNYIEIGDINIASGAYTYNLIEASELPANAKIQSKHNDLLISKVRPNRGAVSIIQEDISNLVVSGAFTVLKEKEDYKKEVLFVLLRTELYREWLLKYNVGTSYPVIKDNDILNLSIPLINKEIQQQIVELIKESFALRKESEKLLEEAKEVVEKEIEKINN
ncbi:MAG: restriction endonuclease subunit S [Bacteroidales bacterium]|nr:restriction endonuclease subunit S [Bacteroidales bacterium]